MDLREEAQSEKLREELIALSRDWERENSCRGYRENGEKDFEGRRVFTVREGGALLAYLFGMRCVEEKGYPAVLQFLKFEGEKSVSPDGVQALYFRFNGFGFISLLDFTLGKD